MYSESDEPVSLSRMSSTLPVLPVERPPQNNQRRRSSLWTLYNYSVDDYLDQNPQSCKEQCMFVLVILGFIVSGLLFVISGPIFCLFKLTRLARLVILWLWLVLMAILLSLVIRFVLYTGDNYTLALGDSRPIPQGLNPLFCRVGEAESLDYMTVQVNDGVPELSTNITTSSVSQTWTIVQGEYRSKAIYLLEGSTMNMTLTLTPSGSHIIFYLIKGESNLEKWKADKDCYMEKREIKNEGRVNQLVFTRDDYYVVFDNAEQGADVQIRIDLVLHRTGFDFTNSNVGCISDLCTFTFDPFSNDVMIVTSPPRWRSIGVTSRCTPRAVSYVMLFILLPLVIGIALSILFVCFCKQEDDMENFPILSRLGSYSDYSGTPKRGQRRASGFRAIFEDSNLEETTESANHLVNDSSGRLYSA